MIDAISNNRPDPASGSAIEKTSSATATKNQTSENTNDLQPIKIDPPYTLNVSKAAQTKQSILEKCRNDYRVQVRDRVADGGNAIESHALTYRKVRDKILEECPESMRRDALAELDKEFESGVTDAVNALGDSFNAFFNYVNQKNGSYHFNIDDRSNFNVSEFKENVLKMAYQARTTALKSEKSDSDSLQTAMRKSLSGMFTGSKLENMGFGDIRTLDTVLRKLPSLQLTDDLAQIGRNSAKWEIIAKHLSENEGLSKPIREKTLSVLNNNLSFYQQAGSLNNSNLSAATIRSTIDSARDAEKEKFLKEKLDNPLAKIKQKLWIVESEWNSVTH